MSAFDGRFLSDIVESPNHTTSTVSSKAAPSEYPPAKTRPSVSLYAEAIHSLGSERVTTVLFQVSLSGLYLRHPSLYSPSHLPPHIRGLPSVTCATVGISWPEHCWNLA